MDAHGEDNFSMQKTVMWNFLAQIISETGDQEGNGDPTSRIFETDIDNIEV